MTEGRRTVSCGGARFSSLRAAFLSSGGAAAASVARFLASCEVSGQGEEGSDQGGLRFEGEEQQLRCGVNEMAMIALAECRGRHDVRC